MFICATLAKNNIMEEINFENMTENEVKEWSKNDNYYVCILSKWKNEKEYLNRCEL